MRFFVVLLKKNTKKERKGMEFYTSSEFKRPIRLCEKTREFAYESLNHKYGIDTRKTPNVSITHIEGYENMTALQKYDCAVLEIVKNAPIRICENEMLSGAATLGDAIDHVLPAIVGDEQQKFWGVSHLTVDFSEVLEIGMDGIRKKAEEALKKHTEHKKTEFLKSCLRCIDCMKIWHGRYLEALEKKAGCEEIVKNLQVVPFKKAESFYEAVQCVWFCFAFLRLLGCWPGIGRIDVLLGKYLKNDLEKGKITLTEAREILAHFFIKGCEWITGKECGSGDAQHYQNIILSGVDKDGNDVTNEVTYLVLDILEETGISDFPTTVRINRNTDERLLRRVAEVIRLGGGTVAVYNEDLILESLADMGYPKEEAADFANDGCWEVQIPGKTNFSYLPFDGLKILQHITLNDYENVNFESFEELLNRYKEDLSNRVKEIFENYVLCKFSDDEFNFYEDTPCTAVALFEHPCIERGLSYREGGTYYNVISPHIGGAPDVANSLYAIKKAVFDDKLISFSEFMQVLKNNWEGKEELRQHILNNYEYFGNDNDEVDMIAAQILNAFSDMCREYNGKTPIRFVSGVSTFGRQLEWAPARSAAPFGRKKGEVLSGNLSPTPGTDINGAAAVIKSYCKADLKKQYTGAALDISFIPTNMDSENAIAAIAGLIKAFTQLGGFFMQIDTTDKEILKEAQKHPENYRNLSVRVSGWNARFVTLNKEWQDMIIERK